MSDCRPRGDQEDAETVERILDALLDEPGQLKYDDDFKSARVQKNELIKHKKFLIDVIKQTSKPRFTKLLAKGIFENVLAKKLKADDTDWSKLAPEEAREVWVDVMENRFRAMVAHLLEAIGRKKENRPGFQTISKRLRSMRPKMLLAAQSLLSALVWNL